MKLTDKGALALDLPLRPDVRRLGQTPCLPQWVVSLNTSIKNEEQRSIKDGKYRTIPTLPAEAMPSPEQRAILERYVSDIEQLCIQTPEASVDYERQTFAIIFEFILSFHWLKQQGEAAVEAKGKAYMFVLKDLPFWAALRTVDLWWLGEAGINERGVPYAYDAPPAPADLRRIAKMQKFLVNHLATMPRRVLAAEPRIEFSEEHCARMQERLASLKLQLR